MKARYQIWYLNTVGTQLMVAIINMKIGIRCKTQIRFLMKYLTSLLDKRPRYPLVNVSSGSSNTPQSLLTNTPGLTQDQKLTDV